MSKIAIVISKTIFMWEHNLCPYKKKKINSQVEALLTPVTIMFT